MSRIQTTLGNAVISLLLFGLAGCSSGPVSNPSEAAVTPAVQFAVTPAGLPGCTRSVDGEVWYTWSTAQFYVCKGSTATWTPINLTGYNAAIKVSSLTAGTTCPSGGITLQFGLDTNRNGLLDSSEVTATASLCNGLKGAQGANGTPGLNSLINVTQEASGSNCSDGGVKVQAGLDANQDGILSTTEVQQTQYVCGASNSCGTNGSACSSASACCSGFCTSGACSTGTCGANGSACSSSSTCCSGICSGGACSATACGANGSACSSASACCSGFCTSGACSAS